MTEQHGLMVLTVLIGLTWVVGGWMQWLNLRRQEGLMRSLEMHRETLHRLAAADKTDPWLAHPREKETTGGGARNELHSLGLVRSSSWK